MAVNRMVETTAQDDEGQREVESGRGLKERKFRLEPTILVVGAIVGLITLYFQVVVGPKGERAAQTLTFVERFDSDRLVSARRQINALLNSADEFIDDHIEAYELIDLGEDSETVVDLLLVEFFSRSESGDVSDSLLQVVSFFGELQVCIEAELCDRSSAHEFLDAYASTFWRRLEPVVEHTRSEGRPAFASKMERFVLAIEK